MPKTAFLPTLQNKTGDEILDDLFGVAMKKENKNSTVLRIFSRSSIFTLKEEVSVSERWSSGGSLPRGPGTQTVPALQMLPA